MLIREEVAGVIAHELAHIKNRDTLTMTITATIAGAISMLAQFGMFFGGNRDNNNGMGIIGTLAMVILAPIAAMLVQMAISRTREYAADRMGAQIVGRAAAGSPPRCAKHRERRARRSRTRRPSAIRRPRTCSSSTRCRARGMDNLFSTHPATENRIAALEQLAARDGPAAASAHAAAAAPARAGARSLGRRSAPRPVGLSAQSEPCTLPAVVTMRRSDSGRPLAQHASGARLDRRTRAR